MMRCHRLLERFPSHLRMARSVRYATLLFLAFAAPIDAIAQFEMQDSTTTASLRGVASPGNGVAWASGTGGTVLRTEDGGFVWQGCAMPPGAETLDFRGVQAFDAQTALVMSSGKGDLSRVYKTTDGCRTWKLVFTNPDADGFFDALQMNAGHSVAMRDYGVVVGDPVGGVFALFFTLDRGDTWEVMKGRPEAVQGEALFAASNQSLVFSGFSDSFVFITGGSGGSRLLRFEICGDGDPDTCSRRYRAIPLPSSQAAAMNPWQRGWTAEALPFAASPTSGAFAFANNKPGTTYGGVVVGGNYSTPNTGVDTAARFQLRICKKALPCGPWQKSRTFPTGYRSSVAYDAPSKTWITVGPNGTDVSRDDGRNWTPLRPGAGDAPDADKQWNALALPFVVGPHGRIGRLREGVLKLSVTGSAR